MWSYVSVTPEVLKELDLAQGALGEDLLAEDIGDLLDGDALVRGVVDCSTVQRSASRASHSKTSRGSGVDGGLPDNTICSLAKLLGDSVALVDDEVLVEDLEDLPSLEVRHGRAVGVMCVVVNEGGALCSGGQEIEGVEELGPGAGAGSSCVLLGFEAGNRSGAIRCGCVDNKLRRRVARGICFFPVQVEGGREKEGRLELASRI